MASLQIQCPQCGQWATVDSSFGGRAIACPRCRQPFTVPHAARESPSLRPLPPRSTATGRYPQKRKSKVGWIVAIIAGVVLTPLLMCGGCLMFLGSVGHTQIEVARQKSELRRSQPPLTEPHLKLPPPKFAVFADPLKVAKALVQDGLPPRPDHKSKQIWDDPGGTEYFFITDRLEVTPGRAEYVGDIANTIVYTGTSRVANQIESVELALDALNERLIDRAVERYKPVARQLFLQLSLAEPSGLAEAIDQRTSFASDEPYVSVGA